MSLRLEKLRNSFQGGSAARIFYFYILIIAYHYHLDAVTLSPFTLNSTLISPTFSRVQEVQICSTN